MRKILLAAKLAALAIFATSGTAFAATVSATISPNAFVAAARGDFGARADLSSQLSGLVLTSGSLTINLVDDEFDPTSVPSTNYYGTTYTRALRVYSCGYFRRCHDYYDLYTTRRRLISSTEGEASKLFVEGIDVGVVGSSKYLGQNVRGPVFFTTFNHWIRQNKIREDVIKSSRHTRLYGGSWSMTFELTQSFIDSINRTGGLGFAVRSTYGDFRVASATLSGTAVAASVPLPAAGWLLLAGLGGMFALRRTRRSGGSRA